MKKFIVVNLKIVTSNTEIEDVCRFKVNINDHISKLALLAGINGQFIFEG
jgi:hypothetical protein